jgi:hypothetical protein
VIAILYFVDLVLRNIDFCILLILSVVSPLLRYASGAPAWAAWAVALGYWLGLVLSLSCGVSQLCKMAVPRFNFIRLLIDLATAHNMPQPIFIQANHPLPGHHAVVCQYSGVNAIGGGETEAAARNTAARQVWIEMGHLITVDPRCVVLYYSLFFHLM